jgi:5-methylcytosine-specific restriction endonuclease McrA
MFFHKSKLQAAPKKEIYQEKHTCQYCGKEFTWTSNKPNQKYCSRECTSKANDENLKAYKWKEERKCAYCGNTFEWHSNKSGQKYCSLECREAATKINIRNYQKRMRNQKTDEELRSEVYLKVLNIISKMDQSKGASFSGRAIDYRVVGDISEKTREIVLERDSHECQVCKRKDSLHLHHLIKRKNGGNHNAENLITLCASCHRHIETGDVEHATNKCLKNAKKYYGTDGNSKSVDIESLRFQLTVLFDKLKESPVGEDAEIMVCLDEALDLIDTD